ncbi:hypothetical protein C6Q14_08240 [Burkholderia ambifaria]|nr:hypothetical protein C6Q14_08240 [Burkholderia ambifaria]
MAAVREVDATPRRRGEVIVRRALRKGKRDGGCRSCLRGASCASSTQAAFGCVGCGCADDHDDVVGAINILARGHPHRVHADRTECVRRACRVPPSLQLQPPDIV